MTVWRRQRFLLALILAVPASGLLVGCGARGTTSASRNIGFSIYSVDRPWHSAYLRAFQEEAKKYPNLKFDWFMGNSDTAAVNSAIENWIARKVDCIVSSSPDHMDLRISYQKALDAGIPVVLTGDVPDYRVYRHMTAFSGYSAWDASRMAAELLDQTLGGTGRIACITAPRGSAPEQQSTEGLQAALQRLGSRIQIAATEDGKWDATVAYQKALDILTRYPRIDAVYAADDVMGSAVIRALKEKGYAPGRVKVVAVGGSKGSIADLKQGWYLGIIYRDPAACARQDLWLVQALLKESRPVALLNFIRQEAITTRNPEGSMGW